MGIAELDPDRAKKRFGNRREGQYPFAGGGGGTHGGKRGPPLTRDEWGVIF